VFPKVIIESNVIMQELEDRFQEYTPLLPPASDPTAPAVPGLLRLERELFSGENACDSWACLGTILPCV
jgi:hypothetical protein